MTPAAKTELEWRGIKPPPRGRNRTTCPTCSPTRRKSSERCMSAVQNNDMIFVNCRHCGYKDSFKILEKS